MLIQPKKSNLTYQDVDYQILPAAAFRNEILYIAPKALQAIPDLKLSYKNNKTTLYNNSGRPENRDC